MPSDADALLAAIWASPHDDLPRLVYADFIEERGGEGATERAEFIRLQVARAAAEAAGNDITDEAYWREADLCNRLWKDATPRFYSRGFKKAGSHYTTSTMPARAPNPPPVSVQLGWAKYGGLAKLLQSPVGRLAEYITLWPSRAWSDADLDTLLVPGPPGALELQLYGHLPPEHHRDLTRLDWPRLHHLRLPHGSERIELLKALEASPQATRLTGLDLGDSFVDSDWVESLAASAAFPRLRSLDLGHASCSDEVLTRCLAGPVFAGLRELDLSGVLDMGGGGRQLDAACSALATDPPPGLKVLGLPRANQLAASTILAVARSPRLLTQLRELHSDAASVLGPAFGHRLKPLYR